MAKSLKILFLYPNLEMSTLVPNAIAILSKYLKMDGFEKIELFDATHYTEGKESSDLQKVARGQLRAFSYEDRNVIFKVTDMFQDFEEKVEEFKPDIIAASIVEDTYPICVKFLKRIASKNIPTIVGGVFVNSAPHIVLQEPAIDYLCMGEGEETLVEVCNALEEGKPVSRIPNLWIKKNDEVIERNPKRQALSLDNFPIQDFSVFEPQALFRPMSGEIYKMAPLETQRGCPFQCTFCNSPGKQFDYKSDNAGSFYRKRTMENVRNELEHLVAEFGIEYIFFITDTFLAMSKKEFDEFIEMYSDFKLPFFMNTRPETIDEYRAQKLKEVGCDRVNVGIEHGNEKYRREAIKRNLSNDVVIRAFHQIQDVGIPVVANNIIGYPDETRDLIFDTIELNRSLNCDDTNAFIFAPYHGTPLRELCVKKNYLAPDTLAEIYTKGSLLNMPSISKKEIEALCKTFVLYVKLPKKLYPLIRQAEADTDEGDRIYNELLEEYIHSN